MGLEASNEAAASARVLSSKDQVSLLTPLAGDVEEQQLVDEDLIESVRANLVEAGLVADSEESEDEVDIEELDDGVIIEVELEETGQMETETEKLALIQSGADAGIEGVAVASHTTADGSSPDKVVGESGYAAESESGKAERSDSEEKLDAVDVDELSQQMAAYFGSLANDVKVSAQVFEIADEVASIRRYFHQHPELAFEEVDTAANVSKYLRKLKLEVTEGVARTGVVALLRGAHSGPCIMLRADMDALPIKEESGEKFSSKNEGVMHACGHDLHMAILLGTARVLSRYTDKLHGSVKFVFQPAEEGLAGAKHMVDEGVLEDPRVSEVYGLHVWSPLKTGTVSCRSGPFMAISERFDVTIKGKGGHAAVPESTKDSVLVSAYLISQLHSVVPRNVSPLDTAVLTVSKVACGSRFNVIADESKIAGTLRAFRSEVYECMTQRIRDICSGIEASFGVEIVLKWSDICYPAVVNEAKATGNVVAAVSQVLPSGLLKESRPVMAGEDFAFYQKQRPGAFFLLGCGKEGDDEVYPHHSPQFRADERVLLIGAQIFITLIFKLLGKASSVAEDSHPDADSAMHVTDETLIVEE